MKIFEFVGPGYDGATDETDHLVFWVAAPDQARAIALGDRLKLRFTHIVPRATVADVDFWIA